MSDEIELKKVIKDDILDNIDMIVHRIYMGLNNVFKDWKPNDLKEHHVEEFINILKDSQEIKLEKIDLERHLGKKEKPQPIVKENGNIEEYLEINIDNICQDIKIANEIFRTGYKIKIYKDDFHKTKELPKFLFKILEEYQAYHEGSKLLSDEKIQNQLDNETVEMVKKEYQFARKWLTCIALLGIIRYQNKANSPYMLASEIVTFTKKFIKNLDYIYSMLLEEKYMIDPENNGLALWDVTSTLKERKIKFVRKIR